MGHIDDNLEIHFHLQAGWDTPEITLRHHLGVQGIDRLASISPQDAKALAEAAVEPLQFGQVLWAVAPLFFEDLPPRCVPTLRRAFLGLRGVRG